MTEAFSTPRIIGHYQGTEAGPLVVAIGSLHGNEPAGVVALEQLFDLLAEEPKINPGFNFKGELLALRGNLAASAINQRFIDQDLNRIWDDHRIAQLRADSSQASSEEKELMELLDTIEIAIEESKPETVIILDLHTTTAEGGIFTITGDDVASLNLGAELFAPVIKGLLGGVSGTTLHYFSSHRFGSDIELRALTFEAGSHQDPLSVDRALAATINLLRGCGCVQEADVRTLHDELLQRYAADLPRLTQLVYVHKIRATDEFQMLPNFKNFQVVEQHQIIARDKNGPIYAPRAGYILMPLYQQQGAEGFFIVEDFELSVAF